MQNNVIKLGVAALLSVMMVACSSTDTDGTDTAPTTAPSASTQGAGNSGALSQEELRRQAALAKTIFYFEFDKSELRPEDRDALVYHAAELKANPNRRIRLEGHADERGTREYNLALGERRAQAVERYLQVQGVSATQMETISYGEERPADTGTTEAAYTKNRRVEMK
ncbi:MAG TPA: peptidoglycan-associated lipoprotein Pal [Hyphomicrobiales bacterium]|nr:peptidoglycan-associated lipoprotein Pal [Hyphomicrobiales bacterium]